MFTIRKTLTGLIIVLVVLGLAAAWLMRGDSAQLTLDKTTGPKPELAEAAPQWFPTIGIAKPVGWAAGEAPVAAEGLTVTRFADKLDHPRTMTVLPNGDVLAAETNGPAKEKKKGFDIRAWARPPARARLRRTRSWCCVTAMAMVSPISASR